MCVPCLFHLQLLHLFQSFFFVPIPPSGLLKGGTDSAHQNLFTGLREYYCIGEKKLYDDFCGSSGNNKKKIWECGVGKKWVY